METVAERSLQRTRSTPSLGAAMRAEDAIEAKQVRNALAPPLRYHLLLTACAVHRQKKHHRHRQDSLTDMPPAAYGAHPAPLYLDTGVADAGVLETGNTAPSRQGQIGHKV